MKTLKYILVVIGFIVTIPLVTAIFVKKDYVVKREITINQPKAVVFDYIKLLKNQNHFSKWATMDPAMVKTYRGTDGTVGFVSRWESKMDDVGVGEQEIKKIVEGERIDYELRFIEPFESTSLAYMSTDAISENNTKVNWVFNGRMKYPMNIMMLFLDFNKIIGDDLQTGLNNLKTELEK